nr:formate/nitrite transporter family protein [Porphyromonas macacae]
MGITKQQTVWWRLFLLGMLAGAYIGIGGLLSVMLGNGLPGIAAENPVIVKLLSGAAFPVGLMLIILVGGELFTGNNATLMPATLNRRIPPYYFLLNWLTVYVANFIGAFLFVYFLVYKTGVVQAEPWLSATQKIAEHKVSLSWGNVFLRGIGANWLVCLAVWMALASQDLTGKIFAIWWPVMTFVVIGFEHSIANMFYLPLGILQGANISWQAIWLDNLLPATLGNIVGGSLLVGTMYTVLYTKKTKGKR